MQRGQPTATSGSIDRTSACALFGELLADPMNELGAHPSPMAVIYLLELLEGALHSPRGVRPGRDSDPTLGETLQLFLELARDFPARIELLSGVLPPPPALLRGCQ